MLLAVFKFNPGMKEMKKPQVQRSRGDTGEETWRRPGEVVEPSREKLKPSPVEGVKKIKIKKQKKEENLNRFLIPCASGLCFGLI